MKPSHNFCTDILFSTPPPLLLLQYHDLSIEIEWSQKVFSSRTYWTRSFFSILVTNIVSTTTFSFQSHFLCAFPQSINPLKPSSTLVLLAVVYLKSVNEIFDHICSTRHKTSEKQNKRDARNVDITCQAYIYLLRNPLAKTRHPNLTYQNSVHVKKVYTLNDQIFYNDFISARRVLI